MYCEKYKDDREKLLEEVQRKEDIEINLRYLLNPEQRSNNRAALVKYLENTGLMNRIFFLLSTFFIFFHTQQHNITSTQNKTIQTHTPCFKGPIKGERERDGKSNNKTGPSFI